MYNACNATHMHVFFMKHLWVISMIKSLSLFHYVRVSILLLSHTHTHTHTHRVAHIYVYLGMVFSADKENDWNSIIRMMKGRLLKDIQIGLGQLVNILRRLYPGSMFLDVISF